MYKHIRITGTVIVTSVMLMAMAMDFVPLPATAAAPRNGDTTRNGQALEIAPPVIYLKGNPGQTVTTKIFLRDISSGDLIVTGQANDFVAGDEAGTPKVLLKDEGENPYSLKGWVAPPASLHLVPREIKTMTVTFNVPADASPGGHYGVIRFTATPPSLKDSGVSLSTSLGALVLFTVNGKINHDMALKDFSVTKGGNAGSFFESGPLGFSERVNNTGNVHEQPTGQITVTDMFNKGVGSVGINHPPRNVLPGSTRKFEQPFDKSVIGNKKLFGRYRAELKLTYGSPKKTITASTVFWVIPYRLIAALAIALVALFFVLRSSLKRYNQRIIEKARSSGTGAAPEAAEAADSDVKDSQDEDAESDVDQQDDQDQETGEGSGSDTEDSGSGGEPEEAEGTEQAEEATEAEEPPQPPPKKKKSSKRKKK